nr:Ig-like domain-containing protein [Oscillospiraceae bacterium]
MKKRILALFLAVILVMDLGCITAFADTVIDFSVSASPETVEIGDTVTATVSIGSCSALAGFTIKLNYDTDKLTLVSAEEGSALSDGSKTLGSETLIYTVANSNGYTTSGGTLFTATFTATAAGEAAFSLEFINGDTPYDTNSADFTPNLTDDSVTISAAAVPATSVEITEGETASVAMGGSLTLHATVAPEGSTDSVAWSSESTDVATIDAETGEIAPVSTGTSVITATAGEQSDTLTLTVTEAPETVTVSVAVYDYTAVTAGITGASDNGVVLAATNVEVSSDATAYDAFVEVFEDQDIEFATQYGNYFSSIGDLAAAAEGYPESGWMFSVNDDYGNLGTADQTLTDGDRLEMHYSVTGYGSDVGSFWAPYIPTITSFTLGGVEKTVSYDVTAGTYPDPDVLAYKIDGEDMAGSGTSADPFVIPVTLEDGTDLSVLTASITTGLHEEYWSLYEDTGVVDITEAQNYSTDVVFAIQTRGGVLKTYYKIQVRQDAESISAINVYDYDDDGEGAAYDGVYWKTSASDDPVLYLVNSVFSGEGMFTLPMEITFTPEGSSCELYPYILDENYDLITDAVSMDREESLVFNKENMGTPGNFTCVLLDEEGLDLSGIMTALDSPEDHVATYFYICVLPADVAAYIGNTATGTDALTASYDENGDFSPSRFTLLLKYTLDGVLTEDSNLWRSIVTVSSEDTDVATVSGFTVTPKARGTAALTFAPPADFWSGFSALSFPASVSAGMEKDETTASVIDLIRALPDAENVTAFEKAAIEAARTAYDALSSENQAVVTNYAHLTAAETALTTALEDGPLYAMRYIVSVNEYTSERSLNKPNENRAEWSFGSSVGDSYASCVLKGAVADSITAVKVDGESATLTEGIFEATLIRPETAGAALHKVEMFSGEEGAESAGTTYVLSYWAGGPSVRSLLLRGYESADAASGDTLTGGSYDENGNYVSPTLASNAYDGEIILTTMGSYPNFIYYYGISYFKAAYAQSDPMIPMLQLNIGSDSYDYEVYDPYTDTVIAERMLSEGDDSSKPVNSGNPTSLEVGANLYFMKIWPVSYNGSTYTRRDTAPSVLAFYIDRADETISDAVSVNSVTAAGTVRDGSYEVAQDGKQYTIETDWNESDVTCTVKVPENVTYTSLYTTSVTGSSYGSKTSMTDTVEDGVRTLTFNWWAYNSKTKDSYEDYEALNTLTLLAEDGVTQDIYKITLKRPAGSMDGETDADLKSLTVSSSNVLTYQQDGETKTGFDPAVTDYTVALTPSTTSFYITALSKFIAKGAAVAINGRGTIQIATNSNAGKSETFPVSAGMDPLVLTIVVTPPEGSAMQQKTYTVTFTKPEASTGNPLVKSWQMTTGSNNQLMAPDTTGSGDYIFSATVALTAYNSEGTSINVNMLYMYSEVTVRGSVDCNCSKVTLTPNIAGSSCPILFSYSVNGGEEIKVEGVSPAAFNIPVPNAGLNTIRVFIRDEQGLVTKIHTFEIIKEENASLESITSDDAVFVGKFNPTVYRMNMLVEPGTGAISVTATAEQSTAPIDFNGVTGTGSVTATGLVKDTEYQISITSGETSIIYYLTIKERQSFSANRVWAVMPAPGQFVNEHSQTVTGTLGAQGWGDGWDTTLYGATSTQAGLSNYGQPGYSLGWFGGFITYEFDDPILNSDTNKYGIDFTVYGNAFYGNAEPAGVEVSADGINWYTLAGSKHYEEDTVWDYEITYYNPDPDFDPYIAQNVYWTDNQDGDGYFLATAGYHSQPAYPVGENYCFEGNNANSLYSAEQLTLSGTKVSWGEDLFFGYADVHPNQTSDFDKAGNPYRATDLDGTNSLRYVDDEDYGDGFDISWAVDD